MDQDIRAFIAIELEPAIREQLRNLQEKLRTSRADVKWVTPTNIHLTVRFLGGTPVAKLEALMDSLPQVLKTAQPFSLNIDALGGFPNLRYPRIIWVGVKDGAEETRGIAGSIEKHLITLGFEKEDRPFSPHITIGRVRSGKNLNNLIQLLTATTLASPLRQDVKQLTLFKSTLTPRGPIYEPLKIFAL